MAFFSPKSLKMENTRITAFSVEQQTTLYNMDYFQLSCNCVSCRIDYVDNQHVLF